MKIIRAIAVISILFLAFLLPLASPVHADVPQISLASSSGYLYPPSTKSLTVSNSEAATDDVYQSCLSWTNNAQSSISVSVSATGVTPGTYCSSTVYTDIYFSFTITYIASGCTSGTYTVTFKDTNQEGYTSQTFSAIVKCQFYLTMSVNGNGYVSPGSGYYNPGSMVTISATPNPRCYTFTGWSGSGSGSYTGPNNPATITMNGNIAETATIKPMC